MKHLGSTTVSVNNKITLIKKVAEELGAKVGDYIVFIKEDDRLIIILEKDLEVNITK